MDKKKDSFILYNEYYEMVKELPTDQKGLLLCAIFEYSTNGNEIELPAMARIIFKLIKKRMDYDTARYAEICNRNKANGSMGGRPKASALDKTENNRTVSKITERFPKNPNEPDIDNDMIYDNIPPMSPLNVDKSVDNSAQKEDKEGKVYIDQDYHVAWDEHFTEELRPLSESQIGEIDYWLKNKFGFQEIPIHVIRSALITKAKRETEQKASNF